MAFPPKINRKKQGFSKEALDLMQSASTVKQLNINDYNKTVASSSVIFAMLSYVSPKPGVLLDPSHYPSKSPSYRPSYLLPSQAFTNLRMSLSGHIFRGENLLEVPLPNISGCRAVV